MLIEYLKTKDKIYNLKAGTWEGANKLLEKNKK